MKYIVQFCPQLDVSLVMGKMGKTKIFVMITQSVDKCTLVLALKIYTRTGTLDGSCSYFEHYSV